MSFDRDRRGPPPSRPSNRPQGNWQNQPSEPETGFQIRGLADPERSDHYGPDANDHYRDRGERSRREYRDHDNPDRNRSRSPNRRSIGGYYRGGRSSYYPPSRPLRYSERSEHSRSPPPPPRQSFIERQPLPRRDEMRPNQEVRLDGLPEKWNEDDIRHGLEYGYNVDYLKNVRVLRDSNTGHSRGFGFVKFQSLQQAKEFVDNHAPVIQLFGKSSDHSTEIEIAYARELGSLESSWWCKLCIVRNFPQRPSCYKCFNHRNEVGHVAGDTSHIKSDSNRDVSTDQTPTIFLIMRDLNPGVTEAVLAKGAAKLYSPEDGKPGANDTSSTDGAGARPHSIKRVLLVRDRFSDDSRQYGFVEFATSDDATAALTKYRSLDKFTIASKPVRVDYMNANVFKPHLGGPLKDHGYFASTRNPSQLLEYWDGGVYVNEYIVNKEDPPQPLETATQAGKEAKKGVSKDKKVKTTINDAVPSKVEKERFQQWEKSSKELHGTSPGPASKDDNMDTSYDNMITSEDGKIPSDDNKVTSDNDYSNSKPPAATPSTDQTYLDVSKSQCLLCNTQLSSPEKLVLHAQQSEKHNTLLNDSAAVAAARVRLEKRGLLTQRAKVSFALGSKGGASKAGK